MAKIQFESISFKNILSFGNTETTVKLNKSPTTLIQGISGAGKSTILEALTFCLYGQPFRNIKKSSICNSINNKDCLTTCLFTINDNQYKIIRGLKPSIFEIWINDNLIDQSAHTKDYQNYLEDSILQLSYKTWIQVVCMGYANHSPFLWLDTKSRRQFVDEILGTGIFQKMYTKAKEEQSIIKNELAIIETTIANNKTTIQTSKNHLNTLTEKDTSNIQYLEDKISTTEQEIVSINNHISILASDAISLTESINDNQTVKELYTSVATYITKLTNETNSTNKIIAFFNKNEICPTCKQSIDLNHKLSLLASNQLELKRTESAIAEQEVILKDCESVLNNHIKVKKTVNELKESVRSNKELIKNKQGLISVWKEQLTKSKIDSTTIKKELASSIVSLLEQINSLTNKKIELQQRNKYLQMSLQLLKEDGIKANIIKSYIPLLNKTINRYLDVMNIEFRIILDERFEETILARFRDNMSYNNLSQGEQARVNLSIILAWREVALSRNSVSTNCLFFDETLDSAISASDTESILYLVDEISKNGVNVFCISHKPDYLMNKFRSSVIISRNGNFSSIV